MKSNRLVLLIASGLGIILVYLRFWNIGMIPASLTHDEIVYAVQAKSLAVQGKTLNQRSGYWDFQPAHPMYAELPAILLTPFFKLISNPLVATRLFSGIIGVLMPLVLAWFSYGLWQNKRLAVIVAGLTIINPLQWQLSRLAYDAVFSTFFYLLGGAILLNARKRLIWWSVICLFIGFFQYQGYKLLYLPWICFLWLVVIGQKSSPAERKIRKTAVGLAALIMPIYIFWILPYQRVDNRWSQTIFANSDYIESGVNDARRLAIDSPINRIMSNKATILFQYLLTRYVGALSPEVLLLSGEPARSGFAVWGHGWFYVLDSVLVLLGLLILSRMTSSLRTTLSLIGFMSVTVLPAIVNFGESWNLLRMYLFNTLLLLLIGWGAYQVMRWRWLKWMLLFLYIVEVGYFVAFYYLRYPILGANTSYLAERIIAEYVTRIRQGGDQTPVVVYTIDPPVMFWSYLVYSHKITKATSNEIAAAEITNKYQVDNLLFTNECADVAVGGQIIIAEAWRVPCEKSQSQFQPAETLTYEQRLGQQKSGAITIPSIVDNGAYFRIYNDPLCKRDDLAGFVSITDLEKFDLSKQDATEFCRTWLTKVDVK